RTLFSQPIPKTDPAKGRTHRPTGMAVLPYRKPDGAIQKAVAVAACNWDALAVVALPLPTDYPQGLQRYLFERLRSKVPHFVVQDVVDSAASQNLLPAMSCRGHGNARFWVVTREMEDKGAMSARGTVWR